MEISELKNLGPTSAEWLHAVGIHTHVDLELAGSIGAFPLVKQHGFNASLNLLYALEAALQDVHWTALSPQTKTRLKQAARKSE